MNDHIAEYLNYYLGLKKAPEFAVLIRGEWGSGKTWFIKDYLERKKRLKYLYTSLNGFTDTKQIEDSFFEQLHPVLASKGMKLTRKILKGVFQATLRFDLNEEVSAGTTVPEIKIPDYLKDAGDRVLIFDDLERCLMPIPTILGYINQFVENQGLKVIILCNEKQLIIDQEGVNKEHSKSYLTIKEKIIGKSFTVASNLDTAFWSFSAQVSTKEVKKLFESRKQKIKSWYLRSGYNNLRHLRLSLLDFERFYSHLDSKATGKADLLDHVLGLFFAISFEVRKGAIMEEDIEVLLDSEEIGSSLHEYDVAPNSPEEKLFDKQRLIRTLKEKYNDLKWNQNPLDSKQWISFFKSGSMDKNLVQSSLRNSIYFVDENTPDWIKLYHFPDLDDDEFERLYKLVWDNFKTLGYYDKYENIHITGMYILFVNLRLGENSMEEILSIGNRNIAWLAENNKLVEGLLEELDLAKGHSLPFHGKEQKEFNDFIAEIRQRWFLSTYYQLENISNHLLTKLRHSVAEFGLELELIESNAEHQGLSVLAQINKGNFIDIVSSISNEHIIELGQLLKKRYSLEEYDKSYEIKRYEMNWLSTVRSSLKGLLGERQYKLSSFYLRVHLLDSIDKGIKFLQIQTRVR
ncbi:MAG: hypothetical protein F6K19_36765 [Cyanothece sp. SIO1E1]|nr:hypothetical protein [Cyanothece sp. SIO1E1]